MLCSWTMVRTVAVCLCVALVSCRLSSGFVDCRRSKDVELDDYHNGGNIYRDTGGYGGGGGYSSDEYSDEEEDLLADSDTCVGATCAYRKTCGRAPLNPVGTRTLSSNVPFIINGSVQDYGEFPSFATILRRNDNGSRGSIKCGGAVLTQRHVLTAYHCTVKKDGRPRDAKDLIVVLGDHTRAVDRAEKQYNVTSICRSKKFAVYTKDGQGHLTHDYAVLTMDKNIVFDDHNQPACLPYTPDYAFRPNDKLHCFIMGWGATGYNAQNKSIVPSTIMKIPVAFKTCQSPFVEDESRQCIVRNSAGSHRGNVCHGDSGGPVLCLHPRAKRWMLVGLISYAIPNCMVAPGREAQAVVTRVTRIMYEIKRECGV